VEWMKKGGNAGFQLADVSLDGCQTADDKILSGTTDWLAAVKHAVQEAQLLKVKIK